MDFAFDPLGCICESFAQVSEWRQLADDFLSFAGDVRFLSRPYRLPVFSRRSGRPGRAPVCWPRSSTSWPLMITYSMPSLY